MGRHQVPGGVGLKLRVLPAVAALLVGLGVAAVLGQPDGEAVVDGDARGRLAGDVLCALDLFGRVEHPGEGQRVAEHGDGDPRGLQLGVVGQRLPHLADQLVVSHAHG
ncbi:hypothetical protein D3C78_1674760 [compost metagenome]